MSEKQSNKDRLKEITDNIEAGIKDLFESDKFQKYLTTMSRFHNYSVNNTILIHMQRPDATLVAGYNKWQDKFQRHVKKGEKGIQIIAPMTYKKKVEEAKIDPSTLDPVKDQYGNIVMEEKEVRIPWFKPVTVFDVSQTDGKPLPQIAVDLTGDVKQYGVFMEALRRSAPVPLEIKRIESNVDGFFSLKDQSITIREGMSEIQTVCAAVHEIAHSKLHNYEKLQEEAFLNGELLEPIVKKDRHTMEVEAESIAYAVCKYYGIDTAENSFGYIATWSQSKELKELKTSLETIHKTSSGLIDDIDRNFKEVCKERGIDFESGEHDREQEFLQKSDDAYAIYQLRDDAPRELHFSAYEHLTAPPNPVNYRVEYIGKLPDGDTAQKLESLYSTFNLNHPADFTGHCLSVSDIIALKEGDRVSYHYCDSIGFRELPNFRHPENYLKIAEMSMEDDYNMIDGVINNGRSPLEEPKEKRPSVLEQLKSKPEAERVGKTLVKKTKEREI